jgi:hypothetical protein
MAHLKAATFVLLVGTATANAQTIKPSLPQQPDTPEQPSNLCLFASQTYTIGARLNGMVCGRPNNPDMLSLPPPEWRVEATGADASARPDTSAAK